MGGQPEIVVGRRKRERDGYVCPVDAFATEQARRGAQILLISEIANAYLALAADRDSLRLSQSTLETQQAEIAAL